jgi:hypothetical protein
VRETTFLEGGVTETKFGSLEGSQAVPAGPSGKGFVQFLFKRCWSGCSGRNVSSAGVFVIE